MSNVALTVIGVLLFLILVLFVIARIPSLKIWVNSLNKWVALGIFVVILGTLVFIVLKVFFPGGPESVLSQVEEGTEEGGAEADLNVGEEEKETGTGFGYSQAVSGNAADDPTVYITVAQNMVKIGEVPFSDQDSFRDALAGVAAETDDFCLVDDYAVASLYHSVEEALTETGISYTTQEKN